MAARPPGRRGDEVIGEVTGVQGVIGMLERNALGARGLIPGDQNKNEHIYSPEHSQGLTTTGWIRPTERSEYIQINKADDWRDIEQYTKAAKMPVIERQMTYWRMRSKVNHASVKVQARYKDDIRELNSNVSHQGQARSYK
ncbi:hypothetical protein DPEC_G00304980 [Dallia pectoralis]|uniref:Uncharacterized protein n=1 Tax=Dallia pectoralis TaxID=75939 RepID=A0ACC2FE03_DALPE|nr:hypothetical protein DPEC_G00304980 [Dallia pectoralis]